MTPQFFVFVENDTHPRHLALIKGLMDFGYYPFVDAKNGDDEAWFDKNLKNCEHRLYYLNEFTTELKHGEEKFSRPDVLVAFSEGIEVKDVDWFWMGKFMGVLNCLQKQSQEEVDEVVKDVWNRFEKPNVIKAEKKQEDLIKPDLPTAYGFRFASIGDIGFYEIVKPHVEEPYVTMVEDYKSHPMDMYTNFFKSQSWGVSNYDIAFLKQLWIHHGETEEFNLEKEYEKRIQRVLAGEKEPLVWRNTLENVMDIYSEAVEASGTKKRKKTAIEIQNKK